MIEENIHCRVGEGAGDMVGQLNTAFAWAATYNRPVCLNIHWGRAHPVDYKVVETDPESVLERYQHMHERMHMNHMVRLSHVFNSDMFSYLETLFDQPDNELRRKHAPHRWIFESGPLIHDWIHGGDPEEPARLPFASIGGPEWKWEREPMSGDTIVFWNYINNFENIKEHKDYPFDYMIWRAIELDLPTLFPNHNIIQVSYRDDFRYIHDLIADCAFCIGYDGMWHTVARNFGKMFLTATGDLNIVHKCTNPMAPAFSTPTQFFDFLLNCARTEGYLKREQDLAMMYHIKKFGLITDNFLEGLEDIVAV